MTKTQPSRFKDHIVCRGSITLGTACHKCVKCLAELSANPQREEVDWEDRARNLDMLLKRIFRWARKLDDEAAILRINNIEGKVGHLLLLSSPLRGEFDEL